MNKRFKETLTLLLAVCMVVSLMGCAVQAASGEPDAVSAPVFSLYLGEGRRNVSADSGSDSELEEAVYDYFLVRNASFQQEVLSQDSASAYSSSIPDAQDALNRAEAYPEELQLLFDAFDEGDLSGVNTLNGPPPADRQPTSSP